MKKRRPKKARPVCTAEVVEVHGPRHGSGGELLRFHLIRRRPYTVLGEYHTRAEANAKRKDLCGMLRKTGGPFKRVIRSWTAFERMARADRARERPYDGALYGLGSTARKHAEYSEGLIESSLDARKRAFEASQRGDCQEALSQTIRAAYFYGGATSEKTHTGTSFYLGGPGVIEEALTPTLTSCGCSLRRGVLAR